MDILSNNPCGSIIPESFDRKQARLELQKRRGKEIVLHIKEQCLKECGIKHRSPENCSCCLMYKALCHLTECSSYLVYDFIISENKYCLRRTYLCKDKLVCGVCAIFLGARYSLEYQKRFLKIWSETANNDNKPIPAHLVLTVKNSKGNNPKERLAHIKKAVRKLFLRSRDFKRGKSLYTEFVKVLGAVCTYETSYSRLNGYHVHAHLIVLLSDWLDMENLSREWFEITRDSYIVKIRSMVNEDGNFSDLSGVFMEVFKYASKPSGMEPEQSLEVYRAWKGSRLIQPYGLFLGVKVDEDCLDSIDQADRDYVRICLRWIESLGRFDRERVAFISSSHLGEERDF